MADTHPAARPHRRGHRAHAEAAYLRAEVGSLLGAAVGGLVGAVAGMGLEGGEMLEQVYGAGTGALVGGGIGAGLGCAIALEGRGRGLLTSSLVTLLLLGAFGLVRWLMPDADAVAYVVAAIIGLPPAPLAARWVALR